MVAGVAGPAAAAEGRVSHADWAPSPLVEGENELRRRRVGRHDRLALTFGALAITGATAGAIALAVVYIGGAFAGIVALAFVVVAFWAAWHVDRRRLALVAASEEADRVLRTEFGEGPGWFVDLIVHRGGAPTGVDRGMLWIEDGRLVFAGHRTSFSLSTDGVRDVKRGFPVRGVRHEIRLALPDGQAVSFVPHEKGTTNVLYATVVSWATGIETFGGQFPPLGIGPGATSPGRLLGRALGATAFYALLGWTVTGVFAYGLSLYVFILFYYWGTTWNLWHPLALWRAWRDRRRLRE